MKRIVMIFCPLLFGCGAPPDDTALAADVQPPAAAVSQISSATRLDDGLRMLEEELAATLDPDIDDDEATARLVRAEAITDRLLETRLPFQWLNRNGYAVDSRLRQIQALADRIIAQIRSGAGREAVLADARTLHQLTTDLRAALAQGGTSAPRPLDELLSEWQQSRRPPPPRPPPPPPPPDTTG
jgi:hypothetical protein